MTELLKENDCLRSSDLSLITALCSYGYTIDAIERMGNKAHFLIKRDENLDDLVQQFWKGELRVEPLYYFNQLKAIKTRLYNIN